MHLARLAGLHFQRIQFTNDMLASDVIGINIFNQKNIYLSLKKGPIFTQILWQMKLIRFVAPNTECLAWRQWKRWQSRWMGFIMNCHSHLGVGTQNPLFQSGTYALPESQLDRFSCVYPWVIHHVRRKIATTAKLTSGFDSSVGCCI